LSLIALLIAAVLHQQLLPTKMPRPTLAASLFILLSISSIAHSTNSAGELFLSENALKAGVTVLPSGLQYSVIISGSGRESPFSNTSCLLHYAGTLIDGTEFDSSYRRGKVSAAGEGFSFPAHSAPAAECGRAASDGQRDSRSFAAHD